MVSHIPSTPLPATLQTPSTNRSILKRVLQRKLHDSRVTRRVDLAKRVTVEVHIWSPSDEAVRHIERLAAKLHPLTLTELEGSRKAHIQLPCSLAFDIEAPHISQRP